MTSVNQLKLQLLEIKNNNWNIAKNVDKYQLAMNMMENIGSTDPVLRDELIFTLLSKMIYEFKVLSDEQVKALLDIALSKNYLFYKIDARDDDAVFKRSFSILVIASIVYYHNEKDEELLTEEEIFNAYRKVIRYFALEQDVRGYDKNGGWAHSIAHTADLLDEFARSKYIKHFQLIEILDAIKEKVCIKYYTYVDDEDERLVTAVIRTIEREIIEKDIIFSWVKSIENSFKKENYTENRHLNVNIKNFLRSLYFRLKIRKSSQELVNEVEKSIYNINKFR